MAKINRKPAIKVGLPEKKLPVPVPVPDIEKVVDTADNLFGWLKEREKTKQIKEIASVKREELSLKKEEIKRKAEIYMARIEAELEKSRMRHKEEMKKLEIEEKIKEKKLNMVEELLMLQIKTSSIPPEQVLHYLESIVSTLERI